MGSGKVRVLGILAAILIAGCSSSTPTEGPTSSLPSSITTTPLTGSPVPPTVAAPSKAGGGASLGLVVLASGSDAGLWTLSPSGGWTMTRKMDAGAAIAPLKGGVAVASGDRIRRFEGTELVEGSTTRLSWPSGAASSIRSFSVAEDGKLALVTANDTGVQYAVADPQGHVGGVESPTSQPFTPIVAWLDANRRLVLRTDEKQASHLALEDSANHSTTLAGLAGCRWFGVSGDGKTIAAVTEGGLYVDSADRFLAGAEPKKLLTVPDGTVAWSVALSRDGTQIAFLGGHVGEDGSVADVHEQVYTGTGGGWQQTLDSKLTFANAVGQAWIR